MLSHHMNSREESGSRKAVCYNTLDIDVLILGRAPQFHQNEPAGTIDPTLEITGDNSINHGLELENLHRRIKLDANYTLLPLDEKLCMRW